MADAGDGSDEYLPYSDDSYNEDEDEDERRNRWMGPPSTWQQLNGTEISTLAALNEIRNQDLSIHLYNAFALKHRHDDKEEKTENATRPVPNQDIDAATGQPVQEDKWVPPKSWTAWPLPASVVPRPDFMRRTDAADEPHAFSMEVPYVPRTELEEAVSATILRLAKEKFRARQAEEQREENVAVLNVEGSDDDDDDGLSGAETSSAPRRHATSRSGTRSASRPRSVKFQSMGEGEMMDVDADEDADEGTDEGADSSIPTPTPPLHDMPLLKAVVATDDELSYSLLRPSAQRILANLDATFTILHTAGESQTHHSSKSRALDASSHPQSRSPRRPRSRHREPKKEDDYQQPPAPKRARPPPTSRASTGPSEPPTETKKRGQGRPRKAYPRLRGETDRAYAIRIARLQKKAIPRFPDEEGGDDADNDDPEPPSDSTPVPRPDPVNARAKSKAGRPQRRLRGEGGAEPYRKNDLSRVRLRDWRDVLGAAALAGFPQAALDRAAQRCADLFGESFTLHTLRGGALPNQANSDKSDRHVRYEPGMAAPLVLEEDSPSRQRRPRGRGSRTRTRTRTRPASPVVSAGQHFCTFDDDCPRAVEPFARRANLMRHLRLVHGYDGDEPPPVVETDGGEGDGDGEDDFLKPIKVRPGWRVKEKGNGKNQNRRSRTRDREMESGSGSESSESESQSESRRESRRESERTADTKMRDADSTTSWDPSD
ncbi:RNA polymerase I-specific transcription initiation factor-domain-containing protein [Nemania sp. NC0429]|nr:RNA polymerase I-specific transcription initiation factor-domain-containing protein [Nemania sp. NC0429]